MPVSQEETSAEIGSTQWEALSSTVVLRITDASAVADARAIVEAELDAIDRACSRFRADSELERVNASPGRFVSTSQLLVEAVRTAVRAAWLTEGAVDPTLGDAIARAGYWRDFSELEHPLDDPLAMTTDLHEAASSTAPRPNPRRERASRWKLIEIEPNPARVKIPTGARLDLGATAKALAADRAATAVTQATGVGVLVSVGGDISTAGAAPDGGWAIHVTDDHRSGPGAPGQTIAIAGGGLATSSLTARRWLRDGHVMHHILDPMTGEPVQAVWRTASVAAATCVDANIASTAALVRGRSAVSWLCSTKLPARLVSAAGVVHVLSGWPREGAAR